MHFLFSDNAVVLYGADIIIIIILTSSSPKGYRLNTRADERVVTRLSELLLNLFLPLLLRYEIKSSMLPPPHLAF